MKRYASHYLCYQEETLPSEILAIIRRDEYRLKIIPATILSSFPKGIKGFCYCCAELNADGVLQRLFPFTEELEATEWYPGILYLNDLIQGKS